MLNNSIMQNIVFSSWMKLVLEVIITKILEMQLKRNKIVDIEPD